MPERSGSAVFRAVFLALGRPVLNRIPVVAQFTRALRDHRRALAAPVVTPFGFTFAGPVSMQQGAFEPEETAILNRLLQDADLFVNVGANIGYYCCLALSHNVRTLAIEPVAANLRALYRNIRLNRWDERVEVFPVAVSDHAGLTDIFGDGTGASLVQGWAGTAPGDPSIVPCSTLDLLVAPRVAGHRTVILADIEGSEHQMLAGATSVLESMPRPIWLLEVTFDQNQPEGVAVNPHFQATFERFWSAGYDAWTADRSLRPVTRAEVTAAVASGTNTLRTHNFVFVQGGRGEDLLSALSAR